MTEIHCGHGSGKCKFARVQGAVTVFWTRYKEELQVNGSNTIEGQHHLSLSSTMAVKRESNFLGSDKQIVVKGQVRASEA